LASSGTRQRFSSAAPRRRGVLLYAVLGLALLLAIFLFSYYSFVMNETQMSKHIKEAEVAQQLARAGIAAGVAWFENTKNPCPLRETAMTGRSSAVNGETVELDVSAHAPLQRLLSVYEDKASLTVTLHLEDFKPMFAVPKTASGVVYNEVEKTGVLRVRAEASYGGTGRTLVAHKQAMVISMLPYVVSKFTLFARELHSLGGPTVKTNHLNALPLDRQGFDEAVPTGGLGGYGVMRLANGSQPSVEDRGWVFLGAREPRFLNLAYGKGEYGEEHHVLPAPWELASSGPTVNPGYSVKFIQKGLFTGLHADNDLFDHFVFDQPDFDPVHDKASLLQLFGSATAPSATIALGDLYRRFLMLRYVRKVATNQHVALPFCPPAVFGPPPSPWSATPAFDVVGEAFSDTFGRYAACMSTVYEEPYNRSVDFIQGNYTGMTPPRTLTGLTRVRHPDGRDDFLYDPSVNDGRVDITTVDGAQLFAGRLNQVSSQDLVVEPRATYTLPAARFKDFLKSKPKRIPGIVRFKDGPIVIDEPLQLEAGGMLCADGTVTIKQPVTTAPGRRPLAIVSLHGDIEVATDRPVKASLVALEGTLRKPQGLAVDVTGNVVVKSLDPETLLRGGGNVTVTFDERLDPTRPQDTVYECQLSPERAYYQE